MIYKNQVYHFLLFVLLMFAVPGDGTAWGAVAQLDPAQALLSKYPSISSKLQKNQFGAPIYLQSISSGDNSSVEMYGVFNHPFEVLQEALQNPPNWCDITSLHINIKACTYRKMGDFWQLTLYSGRKYYQPPDKGQPLKLKFRPFLQQPQFLEVALSADKGPLHTSNIRLTLQAAPLDAGRSFVHFSYSYSYGALARIAMKSYFNTMAKDKIGFSTTPGKDGKSYYIGGERGAIERNAMRYYLAMESYLDSLGYPDSRRFEYRLNEWYDLTAKYPRQLKEDEKGEYLAMKRKEYRNQLELQKREGNAG